MSGFYVHYNYDRKNGKSLNKLMKKYLEILATPFIN